MNEPTFRVRDTFSGKVADVTESQYSVFPERLERVDADAKDLEPGLFKPGTVEEREARSASARKAAETRAANQHGDGDASPNSEDNSGDTEADASHKKGE